MAPRLGNKSVYFCVEGPLQASRQRSGDKMRLILLIIIIILLIGALPTWPYSSGWGYYPVGGLGTLLIIILILVLIGWI